jgi:hypothetical protein
VDGGGKNNQQFKTTWFYYNQFFSVKGNRNLGSNARTHAGRVRYLGCRLKAMPGGGFRGQSALEIPRPAPHPGIDDDDDPRSAKR